MALLWWSQALAQSVDDFHLGTWEGSLEINAGIDRDQVRYSDGGAPTDFTHRFNRERLNIGNQGFYFLDPQLVTGNLLLNFELANLSDSTNGTSQRQHGKFVGYSFDSTFLSNLPYNGKIYATRSQTYLNQPFGRTDLTFQNAPALAVAAYAMLLMASVNAYGKNGVPDRLDQAKWYRRKKKDRAATNELINQLRRELWSAALNPTRFSDFRSQTSPDQKRPKPAVPLRSALFLSLN